MTGDKHRPLTEYTFDELVDYATGEILKDLLVGKFRLAVYRMMNLTVTWYNENKS